MKIFKKTQKIFIFFIFNCLFFSFSSSEEIYLGKFYNQTSLKGEENYYTIKLSNDNKNAVFIDVIIYVGDVEINVLTDISSQETISVNHIILKINNIQENLEELLFKIKAKTNSYYLLFVDYGNYDIDSLMTNQLQTGFSYLINVDPNKRDYNNEKTKTIRFNQKYFNKKPIMSSFFSLNCKFEIRQIYRDNEQIQPKIKNYQNVFYDLIKSEDTQKYNNSLEYKIVVIENEPILYQNQLCQLFASSVEISDEYEENINDIIIPDNNPQQVMFSNDVKHISFGYIYLDFEKGLMIKFFPKHIAQYKIRLYFDSIKREKEEIIIGRNVIFLKPEELSDKCKNNNKGCYIQLDITLEKIKDNENPILEFSFQMIGTNSVSYIPKRILKNDFLHNNNSQYYYTEIGSNEQGFITLNFLRGIGKLFFKIVEKTENGPIEEGNWRGKYTLPDDNCEELYYPKKKIYFEGTKNCVLGCYLLIKIFSIFNNTDEITDANFPISIIINSYHTNTFIYSLDVPVINIQNDEYVVGSVKYIINDETIMEFYSILLNSNAKQVLIDFQSDTASLYINVGNQKPSTTKYHFKHEPKGKDGILTIKKEEILLRVGQGSEENKIFTGLKDIILTLGIKTYTSNMVSPNIFSFVVRLMNETINDIYRVNSDKRALCITKMISVDKYRCIYSIENYYANYQNYLLIYPISLNKSALFKIYGKIINQSDYEFISENKLNALIPNERNNEISNQQLNGDYLLVKEGFGNLLVTVETNINTTVELISSIYLFEKSMYINDYEPKIFLGFKDKRFRISFPNDDIINYMINIRCIIGSTDIYWDHSSENKFHLEGKDDTLSITTENLAKNNLFFSPKNNTKENIGIIFYLKLQPRMSDTNFDELILDSSTNYFYSGIDLPINYFAPIPNSIIDNKEYYEIFFSFNFLEKDNTIKQYYEDKTFLVESNIVDYNNILKAKKDPEEISIQPSNHIKGYYDPLLKTGYIKIKKDNIDGDYVEKDRPYLLLTINKAQNNKEEYNRFSLEVSAIKNEQESPVSESSYQFGILESDQIERIYKLRIDNSFKYIFIKFSCSNNKALSLEIEGKKLREKVTKYGRTIYSFNIDSKDIILFLKIKRISKEETKEYFTFQYKHADNDDIINEYKISKSSKLQITKSPIEQNNNEDSQRVNFNISLNPVENSNNYNITYICRGIDTSNNDNFKIKNEDLSLKFLTNQYYLEYNNPEVNENNMLTFYLDNVTDSVKYIQVIAQIKDKQKERIEYLSYDIYYGEEDDDDDDEKIKKLLILGISFGSFILLVVIILSIIVISYHLKNKNIVDKINKISFSLDRDSKAESESTEDLLSGKGNNINKI